MNRSFSIVLLASLMTAPSWADDRTCIAGATIIDVERGGRLPEFNVVIRGNQVESVTDQAIEDLECDTLIDAISSLPLP